jgi:hypothetical protein
MESGRIQREHDSGSLTHVAGSVAGSPRESHDDDKTAQKYPWS